MLNGQFQHNEIKSQEPCCWQLAAGSWHKLEIIEKNAFLKQSFKIL
jgi:hypothetical protein